MSLGTTSSASRLSRRIGARCLQTLTVAPQKPGATLILLPDPSANKALSYRRMFEVIGASFLRMIALDPPMAEDQDDPSWKSNAAETAKFISDLVREENRRYGDVSKVFIGGFSEGANAAIDFGLMQPHLGGMVALSLRQALPEATLKLADRPREGGPLPVLAYQGAMDEVFTHRQASAEWKKLEKASDGQIKVETRVIEELGHAALRDEYLQVVNWLSDMSGSSK